NNSVDLFLNLYDVHTYYSILVFAHAFNQMPRGFQALIVRACSAIEDKATAKTTTICTFVKTCELADKVSHEQKHYGR
ncbi:MAG: hypothetical protein QNL54_09065, partial [Rhodobacterales bacterium]